jgi:hypothetical protein
MPIQKCPICGSDVVGDVCFSCGFEMPDEKTVNSGIPEPKITDAPPRFTAPLKYREDTTKTPNVEVVDDDYRGNYFAEGKTFFHFCYRFNRMTFTKKFEKYWWAYWLLLVLPAALSVIPAVMMMIMSRDREIRKFAGSLLMTGIISLFVFA